MSYLSPHVSVSDTTTQTIASANTVQAITFDTNEFLVKAAHSTSTNPSRITLNEAGQYLIVASIQVSSSSANKTLDIWFRVNGTDVPRSNTKVKIGGANDEKKFCVNVSVSVTAGQYIEAVMSGDSTALSIQSTAAGTTPTRPITPSIFLTIDRFS